MKYIKKINENLYRKTKYQANVFIPFGRNEIKKIEEIGKKFELRKNKIKLYIDHDPRDDNGNVVNISLSYLQLLPSDTHIIHRRSSKYKSAYKECQFNIAKKEDDYYYASYQLRELYGDDRYDIETDIYLCDGIDGLESLLSNKLESSLFSGI